MSSRRKSTTPKRYQSLESQRAAFIRRRDSIFNDARELCTIYGADVAIILISPYGEIFTFGRPSVKQVLDRYDRFVHPEKPEAERILPYGIDRDVPGGQNMPIADPSANNMARASNASDSAP